MIWLSYGYLNQNIKTGFLKKQNKFDLILQWKNNLKLRKTIIYKLLVLPFLSTKLALSAVVQFDKNILKAHDFVKIYQNIMSTNILKLNILIFSAHFI